MWPICLHQLPAAFFWPNKYPRELGLGAFSSSHPWWGREALVWVSNKFPYCKLHCFEESSFPTGDSDYGQNSSRRPAAGGESYQFRGNWNLGPGCLLSLAASHWKLYGTTKNKEWPQKKSWEETTRHYHMTQQLCFWNYKSVRVWKSYVWHFETPWTIACQVPLSLGFSRQDCWSG